MRKKIALVVYSLGMGGAEKVVSDLSFQFAKQHDVTLILFDSSRICHPYAGELIDINCPSKESFPAKVINFLDRAWQLHRIFRVKRFDYWYYGTCQFSGYFSQSSNHCGKSL
jgi:hypothetical protein